MDPVERARRNRLATRLGLRIARLGGATAVPIEDGLQLATGYRGPNSRRTFTVGDVILTRHDEATLRAIRGGRLLRHEAVHADQWARSGPVGFLLGYAGASLSSLLRTRTAFAANRYEVEADLADGGYPELGRRGRRGSAGRDKAP